MMKPSAGPNADDWASRQLRGGVPASPDPANERRATLDRRRRLWWSILYGSFHPRRRRPARRLDDSRFHWLDWHSAHLLAVAIGILILNVADAFLTLTLLSNGVATEANPFMATLVYGSAQVFVAFKMSMTGCSVILMVLLARYRFMRVLRVEVVLYAVLVGYLALIAYEVGLLEKFGDAHLSDFRGVRHFPYCAAVR